MAFPTDMSGERCLCFVGQLSCPGSWITKRRVSTPGRPGTRATLLNRVKILRIGASSVVTEHRVCNDASECEW